MRIIAGQYSSRPLKTLPGNNTRPTLDKVKEAIFSSLGGFFDGGYALDLYAGSGAIGLEALSRGMDFVVFCDKNPKACDVIRQNISTLGVKEETRVFQTNASQALKLCVKEGYQFDFVYLDPPYEKQDNIHVCQQLCDFQLLKDKARVVIEAKKEDNYPSCIGQLACYKKSDYGITTIHYYQKVS